MKLILLPVLATVVMWCGKKFVVRVTCTSYVSLWVLVKITDCDCTEWMDVTIPDDWLRLDEICTALLWRWFQSSRPIMCQSCSPRDRNSVILVLALEVLVLVLVLKHWSRLFSKLINNWNLLAMYAKFNAELWMLVQPYACVKIVNYTRTVSS